MKCNIKWKDKKILKNILAYKMFQSFINGAPCLVVNGWERKKKPKTITVNYANVHLQSFT